MIAWTDLVRGMQGRQFSLLLVAVLLLAPLDVMARINEVITISDLPKNAVFIDTRPGPDCKQASVSGASCLTPEQLLYPDGHLASFRDINWLLGTLAIDATQPVIVIGDQAIDRQFVAGILYLAGLPEVSIASVSVSVLLGHHEAKQGRQSGMLRVSYLDMPMRDQSLLVDSDLTIVLDKPDTTLSTLDKNVWLLRPSDTDQAIVTAVEPKAAISWYAKLLTTRPAGGKLFIHIDGLTAPIKARLVKLGAEIG